MRTGKISESVLKRSVLKFCSAENERLAQGPSVGGDCAMIRCEGNGMEALHAQTLAVSQPGRMRQAVYTGANNLYCAGTEPMAAMLALMLPVDMEESGLRSLMREADGACLELGMALAGGHTTVSEAVREPVVSLTVLGQKSLYRMPKQGTAAVAYEMPKQGTAAAAYEMPEQGAAGLHGAPEQGDAAVPCGMSEQENNAGIYRTPGQLQNEMHVYPNLEIVLAGYPGKMGTALLARKRETELKRRFPWELVETAMGFDRDLSIKQAAQIGLACGAAALHDVSEGGIFGALWEFCESGGVGLEADLRRIPLRQETIEICEYYGWNPYLLLSGGSVLMAVPDGQLTVDHLKMEGIVCSMIGRATAKRDRLLHNGEECRFLDKPAQDEIRKL